MEKLGTSLGFLPEFLVAPVTTVMIMVLGYVLAKIAAALVRMPFAHEHTDTVDGEDMRMGTRLARFVFWMVWLGPIFYALWPFDSVQNALSKLWPGNFEVPETIAIAASLAISVSFISLVKIILNALAGTMVDEDDQLTRSVIAGKFRFWIGAALALGLVVMAAGDPELSQTRIAVSVLLVLGGYLLGAIVGECFDSLIKLLGFRAVMPGSDFGEDAPVYLRVFKNTPGQLLHAIILTSFCAASLQYWGVY